MRHLLPLSACLPLPARSQDVPPRPATLLYLTTASGSSLHYASVAGWRLWELSRRAGFSQVVTAYGSDVYFGTGSRDTWRYGRFCNLALLGLSYRL